MWRESNRLTFSSLINFCAFSRIFLIAWYFGTFVCLQSCGHEFDELNEHEETSETARKKLICAAVLSVVFMVRIVDKIAEREWMNFINHQITQTIELTGGYMAGSLAIMTDAAHLITDSLTFVIGAFGVSWARKRPDSRMSFGYKRIEVFCAIISIIGIWILTLFILYFAVQRLHNLDGFEINTDTMLVVSILGILVNVV